MKLFDNLLESSAKVADKVAKVTGEYIDKGKEKLNELSLENELGKAQKQLGVLVYALYKSGEENPELVQQYIQNIAQIEAQLEELRNEAQPSGEPINPEVIKFCENCGSELGADDVFCRNCGNCVK